MIQLLAMPDSDLPTRSASGFLLRWIAPRMAAPVQLMSFLDQKSAFLLAMQSSDLVIATGHGTPGSFSGQNKALVMDLASIPDVKGKVIYLLSCETGQQLGPALIQAGAKAYLGYKEDVLWIADAELSSRPWTDDYASPVLMPIMAGISALLDGKTAGEAFAVQRQSFQKSLEQNYDEITSHLIQWNRDNAVLLGDSSARVSARPRVSIPFGPPPLPPLANE